MDYISIINKYFQGNDRGRGIYIIHVTLVTERALQIAKRLNLSNDSLKFIEEASMLHDIGCSLVDCPEMDCNGKLPYICHATEGERILESEGFSKHARVASTHTGVGIWADEVRKNQLPIPEKDYVPKTIEEKIIGYADLFFSKNPGQLFEEKPPEKVRKSLEKFGERHTAVFDEWHKEFGV